MGGLGAGRCSHGSGSTFSLGSGHNCNEIDPRATDGAGYTITTTASYSYTVYHHGPWFAMAALAGVLLIICSLLAGLTLAVCGLDMTLLQLQSVAGTAKQR